ncbi:MAG: hypothetical protein CVV41_10800 [Candidatus Riflebacteria bacterium HGW-Riflebacteria-1]|nr:MAG: hypothetical protein CVV41_10800 [Candidatus Riflebacteria bacterium HGW-Riflebacteria-1]
MKIQKESFYIFFSLILLSAGTMAYFFDVITDDFVVPATMSILKLRGDPNQYADYFSPDVSFFCFFSIICLIILRFTRSIEPIIYVVYSASLFFCFFYFFIAPLESLIVLAAFIVPVFLWHQKRINSLVLTFVALVLIAASWYFLKKPALFLLMLPMCHLFAIRANNALQSRYSGSEVRILARLSSTQKKKVLAGHSSIAKQDLWDIIGPEIEALAESWDKVKEVSMGIPAETVEGRKLPRLQSGIIGTMMEIQDQKEIAATIAAIVKRDPGFSREKFLDKFRSAFAKVHKACYDHEIDKIQAMVSDALFEQFRCRVEEQKEAGVKFSCPGIAIQYVNIARAASDDFFDELHVHVEGELTETAIDIVTGETLNAENQTQRICEFWSFIRKPSAKTLDKPGLLEGSCPNCGAPILIGQATVCQVCSSFIRSGNYDWVLSKITQACEWEYANPRLVASWDALKKNDTHFSIHQIEDRCAVVFWMIRLAERQRKMEPIKRFSTAKCCELFEFAMSGVKKFTCYENVSFASTTLKGIVLSEEFERIYLLVVWSGIPVVCTSEGRLPQIHRFSKPHRDVLVFFRKPGQKTNDNNTLSSAHCRACGGPMVSSFAINCNYCNALLNDGSEWILDKVINEQSLEYSALMNERRSHMQKVVAEVKQERGDMEIIRSGRDLITMSAQMLMADGKIDDAEMKQLREFATRYAMPEDKLQGLIESVKQGEVYLPKPDNLKEAYNLMEAAIRMAMADGELAPEEQQYLNTLAGKFGYGASDLKVLMTKVELRMKQEKKAASALNRKPL